MLLLVVVALLSEIPHLSAGCDYVQVGGQHVCVPGAVHAGDGSQQPQQESAA